MIRADAARLSPDPLSAGHQALSRGAWEEARARFEEALDQEETPQALEGLGMAAWWLDDATATIEARERAYRLYREAGDRRAAARLATWLTWDYLAFRGEPAVANGWIQRARRLLEGLEPVPEHGWLALQAGNIALALNNDTSSARQYGAQMAALGRSLGSTDLQMVGLALEGLALVSQGEVAEGMRRLDEAAAAAVAGELGELTSVQWACCYLLYACERVRDYDRAAQWCDRVKEFCKRWRIQHLFAVCRTHYANVLIWRGAWAEAEAELAAATHELATARPAMAGEGIVRLAELRRRQGRLEEAAALFAQVESHSLAQLGRAALALDQGDPAGALDLLQRFLRRVPPDYRTERAAGLELLVRAAIALGDPSQAGLALAELQSIAATVATEPLRAAASFAEGVVAAAQGHYEQARYRFEDAVDLFERCGSPFEAARSRIELAGALYALDRSAPAEQEARSALISLRNLGASGAADRAAALLRELEEAAAPGRAGEASSRAGLTRRELEVLSLVAQGLSNRKIAERLVLSEHTVHRHVSNMLTKLDLPARSAAAAYAVRHGLL